MEREAVKSWSRNSFQSKAVTPLFFFVSAVLLCWTTIYHERPPKARCQTESSHSLSRHTRSQVLATFQGMDQAAIVFHGCLFTDMLWLEPNLDQGVWSCHFHILFTYCTLWLCCIIISTCSDLFFKDTFTKEDYFTIQGYRIFRLFSTRWKARCSWWWNWSCSNVWCQFTCYSKNIPRTFIVCTSRKKKEEDRYTNLIYIIGQYMLRDSPTTRHIFFQHLMIELCDCGIYHQKPVSTYLKIMKIMFVQAL